MRGVSQPVRCGTPLFVSCGGEPWSRATASRARRVLKKKKKPKILFISRNGRIFALTKRISRKSTSPIKHLFLEGVIVQCTENKAIAQIEGS